MLKLRSAQLVRVKKPNLFNDLKGVFLPEQSNTSCFSYNEKTVKLSLNGVWEWAWPWEGL